MPEDFVECPAPSCDTSGHVDSVKGHWGGKRDDEHSGSFFEALERGPSKASDEAPSDTPDDPQREPQPDPEAQSKPSSPSSGAQSSNPVVDGPEPSPRTNGETSQDTDEKTCPECEGPLFDFTAYSSGQYHEVNGHQVYVRGDYQCKDCAQWWIDE